MIVLDTNIIMEILDERRQYSAVQEALARYSRETPITISALSASTVFYLSDKYKLPIARTEMLLRQYRILDVLENDVAWAIKHYQQHDFEDALQVAVALREGCSSFITLDKGLAQKYRAHLSIELIQ